MAPERPRSLVILDLRDPTIAGGCTVYRWVPEGARRELLVLWESSGAADCPPGFVEATERVVCVAVPPGFKEYRYTLDPSANPLEQSWRGQVNGFNLMIIAILPSGHVFAEPLPGSDWPIKAKLVGDRMAVYWIYQGSTVEPAWRMNPVEDKDELLRRCVTISKGEEVQPLPEPPLPSADELRQWTEERENPIEGPPP